MRRCATKSAPRFPSSRANPPKLVTVRNLAVSQSSGRIAVDVPATTDHEVIAVDYFLPGCPPSAARIKLFLEQVLAGQAPVLSGADLKFG